MLNGEPEAVAALLGTRLVSAEPLAGGFQHETCLLTCTDGRFVVRFGGEHPEVEASVMRAASAYVPVPAVVRVEPQGDERCRPFLALEFVEGDLLERVLAQHPIDRMPQLASTIGEVAGRIGGLAFERPGFFADPALTVPAEPPWSEQLPRLAESAMRHADRLTPDVRDRWVRLCSEHADDLRRIDGMARLVHSDLNPKNLLVRRHRRGWEVTAVLDWEFGYAGCPYADAANFARFGADYPDGFLRQFRAAYAEQAPELAPGWQRIGRVLDLFALSDLVTRPPGHLIADRAAEVVRAWAASGIPADD